MVISNNPLVLRRFDGSLPVEGGSVEVFKKALALLEEGAALSGHSLSGSIRLTANPYRSIVVEPLEKGRLDKRGIVVLLDSIDRVESASRERPVLQEVLRDYAYIDLDLLESWFGCQEN